MRQASSHSTAVAESASYSRRRVRPPESAAPRVVPAGLRHLPPPQKHVSQQAHEITSIGDALPGRGPSAGATKTRDALRVLAGKTTAPPKRSSRAPASQNEKGVLGGDEAARPRRGPAAAARLATLVHHRRDRLAPRPGLTRLPSSPARRTASALSRAASSGGPQQTQLPPEGRNALHASRWSGPTTATSGRGDVRVYSARACSCAARQRLAAAQRRQRQPLLA